MRRPFLAVALALIAAAPSAAQSPDCDTRMERWGCILKDVAGADDRLTGAADARALMAGYFEDVEFDTYEQQAVRQLVAEGTSDELQVGFGPGAWTIRRPDEAALAELRYLLQPPNPAPALAQRDEAAVKAVLLYRGRGISGLNTVLDDGCAAHFYPLWLESNMSNGYKPLRDELGALAAWVKDWPEPDRKGARNLLHACVGYIDGKTRDSVPDFIYSWLKTE